MSSIIKSRKGQVPFGLSRLIDIMLFIAILIIGYFAIHNISSGELSASNNARNFGTLLDVTSLTQHDITIEDECPGDVKFIIEENRITAVAPSFFGEGTAFYHYLAPLGADLPDYAEIDCTQHSNIIINKTVDQNTGQYKIEVKGI